MFLHSLLIIFKSHRKPILHSEKQKPREDYLSEWWKEAPNKNKKDKGERKLQFTLGNMENSRMIPGMN